MLFRAKRSELTSGQLGLLENFETIGSNSQCAEDGRSCSVEITNTTGVNRAYQATEVDAICGRSGSFIRYATFEPFARTLRCQYGKRESDVILTADATCLHGMFSPSNGTTVHQTLHVEEVDRSYHVELDHCNEPGRLGEISAQLKVDGKIIAASVPATPGEDDACLALDFTPTAAGDLDLTVTTTPSFLPAGDYFLQFH